MIFEIKYKVLLKYFYFYFENTLIYIFLFFTLVYQNIQKNNNINLIFFQAKSTFKKNLINKTEIVSNTSKMIFDIVVTVVFRFKIY